MSSPVTAHTVISADPPCIPAPEVDRAVERQFGLSGEYSPLVSERDQNFLLRTAGGGQYVVKVSSSAEPPIVSEFQIAALSYLEQAETVRIPQLVWTQTGASSGSIEHAGKSYKLRLVNYLAGAPLASVRIDRETAREFGRKLASLDVALEGFSHEGEHPVLLWDLQRAAELRELLDHIDEPSMRESVGRAIDDFERCVLPELGALRSQVIHGDANPENVLIDPANGQVSGFIDFGDMVRAPLIFEVAIAASYLRAEETNALERIAPFVAGYQTVQQLLDAEIGLLFDLVRARLATTITLLHWRLGARHDDDSYRKKTLQGEAGAYRFLEVLDGLGRETFLKTLRRRY